MGAGAGTNPLPVLPVGSANERPDDGHVTYFGGLMGLEGGKSRVICNDATTGTTA